MICASVSQVRVQTCPNVHIEQIQEVAVKTRQVIQNHFTRYTTRALVIQPTLRSII